MSTEISSWAPWKINCFFNTQLMSISIPNKQTYGSTFPMSAHVKCIHSTKHGNHTTRLWVKIYNNLILGRILKGSNKIKYDWERKNTMMLPNPQDSQMNGQYECGHQVYPVIPARSPETIEHLLANWCIWIHILRQTYNYVHKYIFTVC
jgi:hypothetical protein